MPTSKTKKSTKPGHSKRRGDHHTASKHYLKVYWPYVPMLLVVTIGLFFGGSSNRNDVGVLAYATEMSSQQLLESTNKQRQKAGKPTLRANQSLATAAQTKAVDMANKNYWAHITPDGKAPWYFIDQSGYSYSKAGENLAYGFATSNDTITGWLNSQTHKDNMLDDSFSEVGFGFVNASNYNDSGKETIVVAMYGQPKGTESALAADTDNKGELPFTTASATESSSRSISWIQNITGGNAPWVGFVVGLLSGAMILYVIIKHGIAFKRVFIHGEQFIVHHPMLDIAAVSIFMVGYVLSQSAGFIR